MELVKDFIMILLMIILILTFFLIFDPNRSIVVKRTLIISLLCVLFYIYNPNHIDTISYMDGGIRDGNDIQNWSIFLMLLITIFYLGVGHHNSYIYLFIISNLIGLIGIISSMDWLYTIVFWELFGISQYLLISSSTLKNGIGLGSSIKYFILSAMTTSILMLSITFIYYQTGSTRIDISSIFEINTLTNLLILIPFLFKLGIAPFHLWAPDLYKDIKISILSYIMIIPKIALLCWLYLGPVSHHYILMFAVCSIIIGGIGMISQYNIIRFFTFSSIAQLGYILLLISSNEYIYMYSIIIYTFSIFTILLLINGWKNPYIFSIICFSMAGFPPLGGFIAKLFVFYTLLDSFLYYILFIVLIISIVSASQYLKYINLFLYHDSVVINYSYSTIYLMVLITTLISIQTLI